ncbi:hypothetical protein ACFPH6_24695 [Streptomyces xiangluensis]|uniref:Uncharacterized protein n=1 Tax=Streptomyces xiangluensis TaxID=2665720 RepID=A0ABV8YUV9_9ACTN
MISGIPELRTVLEPEARAWLDTSVDRALADPTAIGALFSPVRRRRGRARIDDHRTVEDITPAIRAFAPAALDGVS